MTVLDKLVATERAFARAAAETSTKEAFLKFLADDAVVFEPTAVNGKEVWSKRPPSVGLLSWEPVWADISADGSIGYTTGPWEFRPKGKDGDPVAFGEYVTIWKKQKDGEFKAILDIGISHGKPEGPTPKLEFPEESNGIPSKDCCYWGGGANESPQDSLANYGRIYRDGAFPVIGKQAVSLLKSESRVFEDLFTCSGSESFQFCFGVASLGKERRFNFLQVLTYHSGSKKWQVDLDLLANLPDN
jgi:ketosteroid isomerase-like protein